MSRKWMSQQISEQLFPVMHKGREIDVRDGMLCFMLIFIECSLGIIPE